MLLTTDSIPLSVTGFGPFMDSKSRRGSRIQKGGFIHSEGGVSCRNFRSGSKLLQGPGQINKQKKIADSPVSAHDIARTVCTMKCTKAAGFLGPVPGAQKISQITFSIVNRVLGSYPPPSNRFNNKSPTE